MSIQSIIRWFEIAKPEPTSQDLIKQCVFHIEEFIEMLDALGVNYIQDDLDLFQNSLMIVADDPELSDKFVQSIDRLALLDACADQVVTSTGVAVLAGMDFEPALAEVNRSNYTKFNADGMPYIKPNGKIGKNPETYQDPELEPYLDRKANQAKAREKLKELVAVSDTPVSYTSEKITVERVVTEVETYEIYPEQLGEFMDCDKCRLTADFGQPTGEFYSDERKVLTNGDRG